MFITKPFRNLIHGASCVWLTSSLSKKLTSRGESQPTFLRLEQFTVKFTHRVHVQFFPNHPEFSSDAMPTRDLRHPQWRTTERSARILIASLESVWCLGCSWIPVWGSVSPNNTPLAFVFSNRQ